MARILVVDDSPSQQLGMKRIVERLGHTALTADDGVLGVAVCKAELPDLVLMDIRMPTIDGIETTRQLKLRFPEIKIIILTESTTDENILHCLLAGADAYCLKHTSLTTIMTVMNNLLEDGMVTFDSESFNVIRDLLRHHSALFVPYAESTNGEKPLQSELAVLSPRERQVLQLIVNGKSNKEIASELKLTFHTAKAHVCRVIQKLSVEDRTQAAVKAMQNGILPIADPS